MIAIVAVEQKEQFDIVTVLVNFEVRQ